MSTVRRVATMGMRYFFLNKPELLLQQFITSFGNLGDSFVKVETVEWKVVN